jgi:uncharacterized RDD family membrane protein YckC
VRVTCSSCGEPTPAAWERCEWCGAQRLLHHDGSLAGFRPLAGTWRRLLAGLLDVLPLAAALAVVALVPERYVVPGETGPYRDELLAELIVLMVLAWLIALCVSTGARGRTLGKHLLKLHVVAADGRPVGHPRAAMREGAGKVLEVLLLVPWGLAAVVSLAFDERRRAVHDRMAGTVCVRGRPVPRPAEETAAAAPADDPVPASL